MTPAGGSMEQELDEKRLSQATAWELHLAFLKRLGVDVMTAVSAQVLSSPEGGTVEVSGFAEDESGHKILDGEGEDQRFRTYTDRYQFTRSHP